MNKTYCIRKEGGGGGQAVAEKKNPTSYVKFPSRHPLGHTSNKSTSKESDSDLPRIICNIVSMVMLVKLAKACPSESTELVTPRLGYLNHARGCRIADGGNTLT
jgi:hypothetical protein